MDSSYHVQEAEEAQVSVAVITPGKKKRIAGVNLDRFIYPASAADFMYRIKNSELINPWVSKQLKALLARQLDDGKLSPGFPPGVMFSHKTGWWNFYTHDVGIVEDGETSYVLAVFTPITDSQMNGPMHNFAQKFHAFMKEQKR